MKILYRTIKLILISIYVVSGVLLAVFLIPKSGWKAQTVATSSMSPAIPQGSLVIIHRVPYSEIQPDDVITYINPANPRQTITHRVIKTGRLNNLPSLTTKGDANAQADREILGGNVVGEVKLHSRKMGAIVRFVERPIGFGLLIILPAILIIIDEIRILWRALKEPKLETATRIEAKSAQNPVKPKPKPKPKTQQRRGVDTISRAIIAILLVTFGVKTAWAALISGANLTNNTISTAQAADHVLINRVAIGQPGSGFCPHSPSDITVQNTGPGSITDIRIETSCTFSFVSTNHVVISNNNHQDASTGDTSGGQATSGDASNSNQTTTVININGSGGQGQTVELYNPTDHAVSIRNWSLLDNSTAARFIRGDRTIPAKGFFIIHARIGNRLDGTGDRLLLRNANRSIIDAISWGSDATILNPPIPAIPVGSVITRRSPGLDTDSATDWLLSP